MNLEQFKEHIESFPEGTIFKYGISEPFSWRGIYAEVAFRIDNIRMTREDILDNINKAYTEVFTGWKGGDFTYNDCTDIHFEEERRDYTDGQYTRDLISEIEGSEEFISLEHKLVKLAFNN